MLSIFGKELIKPNNDVSKVEITKKEISGHTEAQRILLEIGNLLGYKTYTADPTKYLKKEDLGYFYINRYS